MMKDVAKLFLISILSALALAGVVLYRNMPYSAETTADLIFLILSQERNNMEAELGQRNSKLITENESEARWSALKQSILAQGASQAEAKTILLWARDSGFPDWPIFIKRGYVKDKPVWVSVCGIRAENPQEAEIVTGWDYYVRATDTEKPDEVIGTYSSSSIFPRCAGPNTPFPIAK